MNKKELKSLIAIFLIVATLCALSYFFLFKVKGLKPHEESKTYRQKQILEP